MTAWTDQLPGWFRRRASGQTVDVADTNSASASSITTGGGSENEPVVVWQAANTLEAHVVKGRLESEGIPAFVRSEALSAIYGLTAGGLARADVLVPGLLAEQALAILFPEDEAGPEQADTEDDGMVEGDNL